MKKVLILGPYFHNYNQSIEDAFINLGFETKVLSYHVGTTINLREKIEYNFSFNKERYFLKKNDEFNFKVQKTYFEFLPNIVFVTHGNELSKETMEIIKPSFKILWMMDSIYRTLNTFKIIHYFDKIFLFEKTDIIRLKEENNINSYFMPMALNEKIYYPLNLKKDIDILFIGVLYDKRKLLFDKIIQRFPNLNIKIYGKFYSSFKSPFYHFTRKNKSEYINHNVTPNEVNVLYNRSKICINIHHDQSKYGVNPRFFEIFGSKNLQLVDSNPYILDEFNSNIILTYTNAEDLIKKIEEIIEKKIDTEQYINSIYQLIISNHTYTDRIKSILELSNFDSTQ